MAVGFLKKKSKERKGKKERKRKERREKKGWVDTNTKWDWVLDEEREVERQKGKKVR